MGEVEDEDAENYAEDGREDMRAGEEPQVDRIEAVPDTTPDKDETQGDAHIFTEVFQGMFFEFGCHVGHFWRNSRVRDSIAFTPE